MQQQMVYTQFPLNVNPMVFLTEREIIHLINAVKKDNREMQRLVKKF